MQSEFITKNRYKLFTVGAIGTFMATLDGSILNVALPTISSDLNCSVDQIAWTAVAYSLTLISLMLIFGIWIDKKGYFFAYRFGYSFFLIGSALCALSTNLPMLLFSRVVQAIGTAMFAGIGPGMVTTVFGLKEKGKGIGLMVMMVSAGFMVGPPLGGFLLNYFSWQSIFVINIPIGIVGMFMTIRYFRKMPPPEGNRKVNILSALAISTALVSFTFCLSFINDYALTDVRIWGLAVVSLIAFILFLKNESNPEQAIIGIEIFKNRQFTSSIGAMMFMFIGLSGISILVPFYLEEIRHYEPNQVGLFLIILPIMMFIFAPLSGRLSDKIGFRILTVTGLLVQIGGFFMLAELGVDSTKTFIIGCFILLGIGTGIFNTPNSSALMGSVTDKYRAVTSSILGTTRNIGMSIGVALMTALFTHFQSANAAIGDENMVFVKSFSTVIYISIGITAVALLFSLVRGNTKGSA